MLKLSKVDGLHLPDHYYLTPSDNCLFLREYVPGVGFSGGETNNLISNFKKGLDRKGRPEWRYKAVAIKQIAQELAKALNTEWVSMATLVPIPPSKTKHNQLYDDRMTQVLHQIPTLQGVNGDVRELIVQTADMPAAHTSDTRPSPDEIRAHYIIDNASADPAPRVVGLFDDLLTTGAHFRAAADLVIERFSGITIIGIFVARRIIPEIEIEWGPES